MEGEEMDEILGFNELKIGQRVKARGKWSTENSFGVVEISVRPPSDGASIETTLQEIDPQNQTLEIFDRKVALPKEIEIKGLQDGHKDLKDLSPGVMVKLKGKYSPQAGFLPEQIKVKETRTFNIDLLQGNINSIDLESKVLNVAGFTLKVNRKTMITGL